MRKFLKFSAAAVGVFVLMLGVLIIDRTKNRGLTFGYFGDFNAVVQALEEMPDVEVLNVGANHDVTLEEIVITILKDGETEVRLGFGQNEPFRKARGEYLAFDLRSRIDKAISSQALQSTRTKHTD